MGTTKVEEVEAQKHILIEAWKVLRLVTGGSIGGLWTQQEPKASAEASRVLSLIEKGTSMEERYASIGIKIEDA
jgi:hypothetical protein